MLRRQPVLDRHDGRSGAVRQLAGDVVHQADAPDDEAAAVEVDDQAGARPVVAVDPHRHPVDEIVRDVGDLARRRRRRPGCGRARASRATGRRTGWPAPGWPPSTPPPRGRARLRRPGRRRGTRRPPARHPSWAALGVGQAVLAQAASVGQRRASILSSELAEHGRVAARAALVADDGGPLLGGQRASQSTCRACASARRGPRTTSVSKSLLSASSCLSLARSGCPSGTSRSRCRRPRR